LALVEQVLAHGVVVLAPLVDAVILLVQLQLRAVVAAQDYVTLVVLVVLM
jgi:hypothetical protein